jgi:biotin operon repressor
MRRKISVADHDPPGDAPVNDLIQWYGASLGLFSPRDTDSSCFRIFVVLLRNVTADHQGLRSADIADKTGLSRGTVVHHLKTLREKGLVASADNKYFLTVNTLKTLTAEIREDINDALDDIERVADDIDQALGLHDDRD